MGSNPIMKISNATTHSDSPDYAFPPFSRSKPPPSPSRRRRRNPLLCASALVRGRRTGFPTTPLRGWNFGDWRCNEEVNVAVSARKLAAGIWQLKTEFNGECNGIERLEPSCGNMFFPSYHHSSKNCCVNIKSWLQSPLSDHHEKHGALIKHKSSLPFSKFPIERETRLDTRYTTISTYAVVPVPSFLQAKLERAQVRIKELKAEHRSWKNEAVQFLRKLREERTCWMRREHQKLRAIVDDLKHELERARRSYHKMKVTNSKLVNDIADAKLAAKKIMQDYEKERKAREFMEEVCHGLAKKIEEDKMKLEELKESTKIRQSVDQERKMLQMAEAWREEWVQIKLVDARLILEEKYRQMNNLIADLEVFLQSKDESHDMIEISEADVIRQAVKSVDIQEITEFCNIPPKSDIMCSMISDLYNEARTIESDHSVNDSCTSQGCKLKNNPVHKPSSGNIDRDGVSEDTISLKLVSHVEDQGSSYTPDGSNCTVVRGSKEGKNISTVLGASSVGYSCLTGHESLKSEISDMCDVFAKQLYKKPSPSSGQPSSSDSDGNATKLIPVEGSRRFANRSNSKMAKTAPVVALVEGECAVVCWDDGVHATRNPHITRGIRGRIEWPQGIPKNASKAKLLNASYKDKRSENLVV